MKRNNLGDKLFIELIKGTPINEIFIKLILKQEQVFSLKDRAKTILKDKSLVRELERTKNIYVMHKIGSGAYQKQILEAFHHNIKLNTN